MTLLDPQFADFTWQPRWNAATMSASISEHGDDLIFVNCMGMVRILRADAQHLARQLRQSADCLERTAAAEPCVVPGVTSAALVLYRLLHNDQAFHGTAKELNHYRQVVSLFTSDELVRLMVTGHPDQERLGDPVLGGMS